MLHSCANTLQEPPNSEGSTPQDQKRIQMQTSSQTSHMSTNADELEQALIAQHEPPPADIDGLRAY